MNTLETGVPAVVLLDRLIDSLREYHFNYSEGLADKTTASLKKDVNEYRQWFREIQEYVHANPPKTLPEGRTIVEKKETVFSLLGAFKYVR